MKCVYVFMIRDSCAQLLAMHSLDSIETLEVGSINDIQITGSSLINSICSGKVNIWSTTPTVPKVTTA